MLGSLWLFESYLDPCCVNIVVATYHFELGVRWSWIRAQRGFPVKESLPGVECNGQANQQDIADLGCLLACGSRYCD